MLLAKLLKSALRGKRHLIILPQQFCQQHFLKHLEKNY
jgi:hypothetical protein